MRYAHYAVEAPTELSLELSDMHSCATGIAKGSQSRSRRMRTQKDTVLIVEDDGIVSSVFRDIVEDLGLNTICCADAGNALELFYAYQSSVGCMILDYGVPGMHPAQLISRVKDRNPSISIIVSSGYASEQVEVDLPLAAITMFLPKPFDPMALSEILKEAVQAA